MSKRPAWSHSALNQYETCAYQYYRLRVKKDVKDTMNEAALWGNEVHKHLDKRISKGTELPPRFEKYEKYAKRFADKQGVNGQVVVAEQQLCINDDMEPTSWFAKDAWCRGIIDVAVFKGDKAFAGDWKTGKRKQDSDQLALFAGLMFAHHEELQEVNTAFIWFKENKIDKDVFFRERQHEIWQRFMPRVAQLEKSFELDRWPHKPSGLCRGWCPVKDCKYYESR